MKRFWILVVTLGVCTGAIAAPAKRGRIEVILLDRVVMVDDKKFDRIENAMRYLTSQKPAAVVMRVCLLTHESDVIRFQRALYEVHEGFMEIQRLPKNAVECAWNSPQEYQRNS